MQIALRGGGVVLTTTQHCGELWDAARASAREAGRDEASASDVLLALTTLGKTCVAGAMLAHVGCDPEALRVRIQRLGATDDVLLHDGSIDLMQRAGEEALSLDHRYIGTEHVLLALLPPERAAGRLLHDCGATRPRLIDAFYQMSVVPPKEQYLEGHWS